jgi:outer membrane biosynthesis protein TonB
MKKIRKQFSIVAMLTLSVAGVLLAGCSPAAKDPEAKAPEANSAEPGVESTKKNPEPDSPAATPEPVKKEETAAKPSTEPAKEEEEPDTDTTDKKRVQESMKAAGAVPRTPSTKPRTPAPAVAPKGDVSGLVGTYTIDLPEKNEKINKDLAKKGKPMFTGWIKIAANGTYQYMFGTTKGGNVISGSIVVDPADPSKIALHPIKVNDKPATAEGAKLIFNMRVTPDKKSLLMNMNAAGGKTFPVKFTRP